MDRLSALLLWIRDTTERLLQGEPLRAIVYGAAVVIWLVVGIANALGITRFGATISLTDAMTQATVAAAVITEIARRYVWSPASVQQLLIERRTAPPAP